MEKSLKIDYIDPRSIGLGFNNRS